MRRPPLILLTLAVLVGAHAQPATPEAPDPIAAEFIARVQRLAPPAEYPPDAGWARHVTEVTDADLAAGWASLDPLDRDPLLDAFDTGRSLLLINAQHEQLVAASVMVFDSPESALAYLTTADALSEQTYTAEPAPFPADTPDPDATTDDEPADDGRAPDPPPATYADYAHAVLDTDSNTRATHTTATLTVPGTMPSTLTVTRAVRGHLACEVVTVNTSLDDRALADWLDNALTPINPEPTD